MGRWWRSDDVILELAYPFIIGFIIPNRGASYSFTITAANYYSIFTGFVYGSVGSIDTQPIPSHTITFLMSSNSSDSLSLSISGDASSLLNGKHVWISGTDYGLGDPGAQFYYDSGSNSTVWQNSTAALDFVIGNNYYVELK